MKVTDESLSRLPWDWGSWVWYSSQQGLCFPGDRWDRRWVRQYGEWPLRSQRYYLWPMERCGEAGYSLWWQNPWHTVLLPIHALITFSPGAKMSTAEPKLEKEARASAIVLAPTVLAEGTRAGEVFAALALSLPAATWIMNVSHWSKFL